VAGSNMRKLMRTRVVLGEKRRRVGHCLTGNVWGLKVWGLSSLTVGIKIEWPSGERGPEPAHKEEQPGVSAQVKQSNHKKCREGTKVP